MEIIRESTANYEEFENINYGVVFEYDDYFYIKIDYEARIEKIKKDEEINAVCLNDGETAYFGPTDRIKIVEASLMIKE